MKLSIAEGLYLIALDDEEGRLLSAAERTIIPGLISAAILELHIHKRISLSDEGIKVEDLTGLGNGVLDKILKKIRSGVGLIDQIETLAHDFKDLQTDIDELLVHRGILKREETKMLWIPLSERMGNANYAFEQEIRNAMHAIVFKKAKAPASFVVLMSLIYDCKILDEVFSDKDDLIDAVKVAKDIVNSPQIDEPTSKALKELRTYFANK
ncbi:MAG: GPP34 family phosphoprotein [Cyclobacteriaceae bacterium]